MKKLFYIISTFALLLILQIPASAQENDNCLNFINNIEKYYNEGNYLTIVNEANNVLKNCKLTKDQKLFIYKYLIPSLDNLGFDSLVTVYSKKFLELNPFYQYSTDDPDYFQFINQQFNIYPKFTFGYIGGLDRVSIEKTMVYSLLDSINYDQPYYSRVSILSFIYGEMNWTPYLSTGMALGLMYYNYYRQLLAYHSILITYSEKAPEYKANAYAKIRLNSFKVNKFSPYIKAGFYVSFTPKFTAELSYEPVNDQILIAKKTRYLFLPNDSRNQLRYGVELGLGTQINLQRFNLFFELGYQKDLIPYITPQGVYIPELVNGFYYVSDIFSLDKMLFQTGFSINLNYKVEKKFKEL